MVDDVVNARVFSKLRTVLLQNINNFMSRLIQNHWLQSQSIKTGAMSFNTKSESYTKTLSVSVRLRACISPYVDDLSIAQQITSRSSIVCLGCLARTKKNGEDISLFLFSVQNWGSNPGVG